MTNGRAVDGEGPGWVGGAGQRRKAEGSGRADLVICGPSTLSLPWTHLSSSGVIGGEAAATRREMLYNDSHFPALSSLATAAAAAATACAG